MSPGTIMVTLRDVVIQFIDLREKYRKAKSEYFPKVIKVKLYFKILIFSISFILCYYSVYVGDMGMSISSFATIVISLLYLIQMLKAMKKQKSNYLNMTFEYNTMERAFEMWWKTAQYSNPHYDLINFLSLEVYERRADNIKVPNLSSVFLCDLPVIVLPGIAYSYIFKGEYENHVDICSTCGQIFLILLVMINAIEYFVHFWGNKTPFEWNKSEKMLQDLEDFKSTLLEKAWKPKDEYTGDYNYGKRKAYESKEIIPALAQTAENGKKEKFELEEESDMEYMHAEELISTHKVVQETLESELLGVNEGRGLTDENEIATEDVKTKYTENFTGIAIEDLKTKDLENSTENCASHVKSEELVPKSQQSEKETKHKVPFGFINVTPPDASEISQNNAQTNVTTENATDVNVEDENSNDTANCPKKHSGYGRNEVFDRESNESENEHRRELTMHSLDELSPETIEAASAGSGRGNKAEGNFTDMTVEKKNDAGMPFNKCIRNESSAKLDNKREPPAKLLKDKEQMNGIREDTPDISEISEERNVRNITVVTVEEVKTKDTGNSNEKCVIYEKSDGLETKRHPLENDPKQQQTAALIDGSLQNAPEVSLPSTEINVAKVNVSGARVEVVSLINMANSVGNCVLHEISVELGPKSQQSEKEPKQQMRKDLTDEISPNTSEKSRVSEETNMTKTNITDINVGKVKKVTESSTDKHDGDEISGELETKSIQSRKEPKPQQTVNLTNEVPQDTLEVSPASGKTSMKKENATVEEINIKDAKHSPATYGCRNDHSELEPKSQQSAKESKQRQTVNLNGEIPQNTIKVSLSSAKIDITKENITVDAKEVVNIKYTRNASKKCDRHENTTELESKSQQYKMESEQEKAMDLTDEVNTPEVSRANAKRNLTDVNCLTAKIMKNEKQIDNYTLRSEDKVYENDVESSAIRESMESYKTEVKILFEGKTGKSEKDTLNKVINQGKEDKSEVEQLRKSISDGHGAYSDSKILIKGINYKKEGNSENGQSKKLINQRKEDDVPHENLKSGVRHEKEVNSAETVSECDKRGTVSDLDEIVPGAENKLENKGDSNSIHAAGGSKEKSSINESKSPSSQILNSGYQIKEDSQNGECHLAISNGDAKSKLSETKKEVISSTKSETGRNMSIGTPIKDSKTKVHATVHITVSQDSDLELQEDKKLQDVDLPTNSLNECSAISKSNKNLKRIALDEPEKEVETYAADEDDFSPKAANLAIHIKLNSDFSKELEKSEAVVKVETSAAMKKPRKLISEAFNQITAESNGEGLLTNNVKITKRMGNNIEPTNNVDKSKNNGNMHLIQTDKIEEEPATTTISTADNSALKENTPFSSLKEDTTVEGSDLRGQPVVIQLPEKISTAEISIPKEIPILDATDIATDLHSLPSSQNTLGIVCENSNQTTAEDAENRKSKDLDTTAGHSEVTKLIEDSKGKSETYNSNAKGDSFEVSENGKAEEQQAIIHSDRSAEVLKRDFSVKISTFEKIISIGTVKEDSVLKCGDVGGHPVVTQPHETISPAESPISKENYTFDGSDIAADLHMDTTSQSTTASACENSNQTTGENDENGKRRDLDSVACNSTFGNGVSTMNSEKIPRTDYPASKENSSQETIDVSSDLHKHTELERKSAGICSRRETEYSTAFQERYSQERENEAELSNTDGRLQKSKKAFVRMDKNRSSHPLSNGQSRLSSTAGYQTAISNEFGESKKISLRQGNFEYVCDASENSEINFTFQSYTTINDKRTGRRKCCLQFSKK